MDRFTLAEFAKNSENKEGESFTPSVQESGIEQGSLIVSSLYNTMLGEITKTLKSWDAELLKVLTEADIVPSDLSTEQLFTAITRLIAKTHGRNIGDVYYSQSSSSTDNPGALPLFTGESVANVSNVYPQFYAWLVAHPSLCISSSAYDQKIAQYGECPFYVLDVTNNIVRLPKLVNYVKMANTTDGISQAGAGLPNITGGIDASSSTSVQQVFGETTQAHTVTSGAFEGIYGNQSATEDAGGGPMLRGFTFDASRSNSIYGNSNTVTPSSTTLFPWLVVFNTAVPASTAQAAEFQQALTGKADTSLGNLTSSANSVLLSAITPNTSAGIVVPFPLTGSVFTAPATGYYYAMGFISSNYSQAVINGVTMAIGFWGRTNTNVDGSSVSILLNEGDELYFTNNLTQVLGSSFYPLKGV